MVGGDSIHDHPHSPGDGGAGFVGSHGCKALACDGFLPVSEDSLVNGDPEVVRWGPLELGELADGSRLRLRSVIEKHQPYAVLHFAGFIEAGESVLDPQRFYANNVWAAMVLLEVMREAGVRSLVFSSSAAVYGNPDTVPIPESHPIRPVNPYGWTKAMTEQMLADLSRAEDFRYCALRYFNASGADPAGGLAETHDPETHLIPLAIQAAYGRRSTLQVFGTDYDAPRRADDPSVLVADPRLAHSKLGWPPRFTDLADHVVHAAAALRKRWSTEQCESTSDISVSA